jgi:hypothetical protein
MNKRTIIVVGASTAIGFLGDVMTYSVAASKQGDGKFRFVIPKGKDLASVLLLGIVGGFVIDWTLKKIEESLMTEEEKKLNELVMKERDKIEKGQIFGKTPTSIIWA